VDVARALSDVLPGVTVSQSSPDRLAYARDLWPRRLLELRSGRAAEHRPLAVVWPRTTEHVVSLVRFAREEGIALVPFGAGSGVCGGVEPNERTVVVDLKKISDWRIEREAPLLDVGAGAMGITLEEDVNREGFTIGHFPSSILCSTAGGWVAARGAGQCSGLYGKIEDMVVSIDCVLGTGDVVQMQRRFDAPNLLPLMIGSEGTLGVITRTKLRLHPAPEARAFAAFSCSSIQAGWTAMRALFQAGLRPAVSRLYDPIDSTIMKSGSVRSGKGRSGHGRRGTHRIAGLLKNALRAPRALNAAIEALEGNLLGGSTLVLVFEGRSEEVHADAARAAGICRALGAAELGEGPAQKWFLHRYSVSYRQSPVFRLGAFSDTMEVAAPWSKLDALYDGVRRALGRHVLVMAHLSHAYPDGCSIYFTFSGAASDDARALDTYDHAWRDALTAAIECGGTLSHHHGVGRSKAPRLGEELGYGVELVRRVMRAWDPDQILNPGNLAPRDGVPVRAPEPVEPFLPGRIDDVSLLATFSGQTTLGEVQAALERSGLALAVSHQLDASLDLDGWLARGLPGAADAWSDPVGQHVAGFVARLNDGARLVVRPAPRRAVGPDLCALFLGAGGRVGRIEQATLAVRRREAPAPRALPFRADRSPGPSAAEQGAWERVVSSALSG
jgi:alkyldihydroxyacetonephosphate synthase